MLLNLPSAVSVYVCLEPTDVRCSFDKLAALVQSIICQNPLSGHLFVFVSKRRNIIKILFRDRTGYCQYFKRLENGTYPMPVSTADGPRSMPISLDALKLLLDGIDILGIKRM